MQRSIYLQIRDPRSTTKIRSGQLSLCRRFGSLYHTGGVVWQFGISDLSSLSWPSSASIYTKSLVFAMCIGVLSTEPSGTGPEVPFVSSSWLLALLWTSYRVCV
ncbi:hypothetical protein CRV24_008725 [Beauveria bassiana]|nr:hypothetical protein CRV24_008725 [Beauveria bassiana]